LITHAFNTHVRNFRFGGIFIVTPLQAPQMRHGKNKDSFILSWSLVLRRIMFFRFWGTGWLTVGLLFSGPTLAAEIVRNLGEEREPLIITQNGEAKVVMQDIESYEQTQETMALLKILAQGVSNFYRL
jgi:prevent-host-death family protein